MDAVNSSSTKFECFDKEAEDHKDDTTHEENPDEEKKFNKVVKGSNTPVQCPVVELDNHF